MNLLKFILSDSSIFSKSILNLRKINSSSNEGLKVHFELEKKNLQKLISPNWFLTSDDFFKFFRVEWTSKCSFWTPENIISKFILNFRKWNILEFIFNRS